MKEKQFNDRNSQSIQFIFYNTFVYFDGKWMPMDGTGVTPRDWDHVNLIMQNWRNTGMDLMIAFDDHIHSCLYLGHYNDGIK